MSYKEKAMAAFHDGCNCAQAVLVAFRDLTGLDEKTALRLASSFGGGIGRQREVCGAVSGMCMVAGLLYGYDELGETPKKAEHYRLIQELCRKFKEENGSIICRELLSPADRSTEPTPAPRTAAYYKKRPCSELVGAAAEILADWIRQRS